MTGKIINFNEEKKKLAEGTKEEIPSDTPSVIPSEGSVFEDLGVKPPAQIALEDACTRGFTDVIIIGIKEDHTTCMLSVPADKAIFDLTHAIYQLNKQVDDDD